MVADLLFLFPINNSPPFLFFPYWHCNLSINVNNKPPFDLIFDQCFFNANFLIYVWLDRIHCWYTKIVWIGLTNNYLHQLIGNFYDRIAKIQIIQTRLYFFLFRYTCHLIHLQTFQIQFSGLFADFSEHSFIHQCYTHIHTYFHPLKTTC